MIRYAAYDPDTGRITRTGYCAPGDLALQGTAIVSDVADDRTHYIADGELQVLPERPSRFHAWAGEALGWVDGRSPADVLASQAAEARVMRDSLLRDCDWTQLPDSPLSAEARAAWAAHRQALRDITEQPGFPASVDWPVPPA